MPYDRVAYRALREAGELGLWTNYQPTLVRYGLKRNLELACRDFARVTSLEVPRPRTWLPPEGYESFSELDLPKLTLLAKRSAGTRGVGTQMLVTPFSLLTSSGGYVIQELLQNPLLHEGRKVDFRAYVLVTGRRVLSYHVLPLVLVRLAPTPFAPDRLESQLCNLGIGMLTEDPTGGIWSRYDRAPAVLPPDAA